MTYPVSITLMVNDCETFDKPTILHFLTCFTIRLFKKTKLSNNLE